MTTTTVTHAQLVEAVKAYRSFGSKIRAEVKAGKPDLFIDRNRRFQKVIGGKLVDAEHMDLLLALADEQVALDGIAFAKAFPDQSGDTEVSSRVVLRSARQRIKAILSDEQADEALATLPAEVITELTGAEAPVAMTGGWYLVPAEGARLTERHDLLGPYTTQDMAEHMRTTYAAEGIEGVVVQSATRPVLAQEPTAEDIVKALNGSLATTVAKLSPPVELHALHMRREYSGRVFRVLGIELGGVWLQALGRTNDPIIRYGHELIEDLWIACEADGTPYEPDVSVMTLTELTRFRRDCAKTFRSPVRLDDSSYKWAARYTEEIDQELMLREQTGLRAALILEASNVTTIEHGERNDYEVPEFVVKELADVRLGIERHLADYGTLVR